MYRRPAVRYKLRYHRPSSSAQVRHTKASGDTDSVPECGRLWVTMMPDNPPATKASMQKCRSIRHQSHTFKFSQTADATYSNCRRINARQQARCPHDQAGPTELSCRTPRMRATHHMHRKSDTCHVCGQITRCHSPPGGEFMSPKTTCALSGA